MKLAPCSRVVLVANLLSGCGLFSAAAPAVVADVACVIANDQKPISQIVLACGGDTAQVIAILADPANYAKVASSPAYVEMQRVRASLSQN